MTARRNKNEYTVSGDIAQATLRRFPDQPLKTLARYLVAQHGPLFDNDIENARKKLRYYAGSDGEYCRKRMSRSSLVARVPMPPTQIKRRVPYVLPAGKWLIMPDLHVPFHEPRAVESAIAYGQSAKVDGVLLLGDAQDCEAVSYWRATRKRDFCAEVEIMADFLDFLRGEFPRAKIVLKKSNHEDRLDSYYRSNAPQLADLPTADLETVLSLENRGIDTVDSRSTVKAGHLSLIHGHEVRGGSTVVSPARWLALKWQGNSACAHFHRTSEHNSVTGDGMLNANWSFGCLCDLKPDYAPCCSQCNWGFGYLVVDKDGPFELTNLRILPGGKVV